MLAQAPIHSMAKQIQESVRTDPHVRKRWVRRLLHLGWSHQKIRRTLPVAPGLVKKLAKCWTKYPPRCIAKAEALLKKGMHWRAVSEKTGLSMATLQRRIAYRKYPPLTDAELSEATDKLKGGQDWDTVAHGLGCCRMTLQKQISWRKTKARIDGTQSESVGA